MAGTILKKRSRDDAPKAKPLRPTKKQRKQALEAYHSDSAADASADEFPAVNLLDSDSDDVHNARADDGGASDDNSGSDYDNAASLPKTKTKTHLLKTNFECKVTKPSIARDAPPTTSSSSSDDDDDDAAAAANTTTTGSGGATKRTDPAAFATALARILATKLAAARRADPVLARSAAAHAASRQAADGALERRARKQLRGARRAALERGRVRDVLGAAGAADDGAGMEAGRGETAGETAGQVLATERRLRKVAQRGVVQLFNAFRTAQVKAAEAERGVRKEGVVGVDRRKAKVTDMSKKGFLDLIAGSGGGLKKGPMEEA